MEIVLGCAIFAEVVLGILFAHGIGRFSVKDGWLQYC